MATHPGDNSVGLRPLLLADVKLVESGHLFLVLQFAEELLMRVLFLFRLERRLERNPVADLAAAAPQHEEHAVA